MQQGSQDLLKRDVAHLNSFGQVVVHPTASDCICNLPENSTSEPRQKFVCEVCAPEGIDGQQELSFIILNTVQQAQIITIFSGHGLPLLAAD